MSRDITKRRGGDSNPRWTEPPIPVFETGAFNRSATSPGYGGPHVSEQGGLDAVSGGGPQGDDLSMGGGVGPHLALVMAGADDLAVLHHHRAHGDVVVLEGARGLTQGETHEVLVAGEEVGQGHWRS